MAPRFSSFLVRLTQAPPQRRIEAVTRNLEHLLNLRKGCGSVIAGLGLGDYEAGASTHHAVQLLRAELEQLVRSEPRLADPRVRLLGRIGYCIVRFELQGRVGDEARILWLDIDTTTRRVEVTLEAV